MDYRFATRAVRSGEGPPPDEIPLSTPIYQTSTFVMPDADAYASSLHQPGQGYVYTRHENPTTAALERAVADLEGGRAALATASGMGAITTTLLTLAGSGDHIVASRAAYGGTYAFLHTVAPRFGIEVSFVATTPEAVAAALRPRTVAVYTETVTNPTIEVADITGLSGVTRPAGVPLVVDNTVASPALRRPLEEGADIVVHSATKYLGGHSDVLGGVAVFSDPVLHKRTWDLLIQLGPTLDPFAAWLVLRGLKTLELRMHRHTATAGRLVELLAGHEAVSRVRWPGFGGLLAFELDSRRSAQRFTESTRLCRLAASLGGPETLVSHAASTTHRQYDAEALAVAGIDEGLVRVSTGLEDPEDLLADVSTALEEATRA